MSKRSHHNHSNSPLRKSWLLLGMLAGLMLTGVGHALDIPVTDGGEGYDVKPGDGHCATAGNVCTLRAAIQELNAPQNAGPNKIRLLNNVTLNRNGAFENAGKDGDLNITNDLIIEGNNFTVTGNTNDRVFHIQNGATVTLRNMTITGGQLNVTSTTVPQNQIPGGGGILVQGNSTLNLESVSLIYNHLIGASSYILTGGGLYVDSLATAYIKDSFITNNDGPGGGGLTNLGHTEIRNTHITDNSGGTSNGGGVRNMGGYLHIGDSFITSNSANMGGGISSNDLGLNLGNVIISNSVINLNRATQFGGGIHNESPVTLTNSTVNNNTSGYDGGGIYNSSLGNMDIINSTISSNDGRSGGGIYNTRAISITNATIYNNRSIPCVAAACGANGSVGGNQIAIFGGDLGSSPGLTIVNTIIANGQYSNLATEACAGLTGYTSLIHSSGGNLENGHSCGLINTDIPDSANLGLNPTLAQDVKFTGTTPVHALLPGSEAINKANGSLCPQVDQRFLSRSDGQCDIGAYEFGATVSQITNMVDLKLTMSDSPDPVKPNDIFPLTYKVVLTNLYVNASASTVVLRITLPIQFLRFNNITTTSTTQQPDCDKAPDAATGVIECRMTTLPGLGRVEVFITGFPTADGVTTITASADVESGTPDAFSPNNHVTEDTVVDKNAKTTLNFGGDNTGGGGGGGVLHPAIVLVLGGILLARRQRRH